MKTKSELRHDISTQRKALHPRWMKSASAALIENIHGLPAFQTSQNIALYMAITGEVNLDLLFPDCWKLKKQTCIPVFNAERKIYELARVSETTDFQEGHYGIREPRIPRRVSLSEVDLILVPGVAFDRSGNRLGRGGGYYDRLLKGYSGSVTAVAFNFQLFETIPTSAHDVPVGTIVTETKIINVCNEH